MLETWTLRKIEGVGLRSSHLELGILSWWPSFVRNIETSVNIAEVIYQGRT